jgi:hypothetical protein
VYAVMKTGTTEAKREGEKAPLFRLMEGREGN